MPYRAGAAEHLTVQAAVFSTAAATQSPAWTLCAAVLGATVTWLLGLVSKGLLRDLAITRSAIARLESAVAKLEPLACPFARDGHAKCAPGAVPDPPDSV